jgi:DNA-binding MltR family transcriptional regulator
MQELTGKCLELFLIFLIEHFRKNRPDYIQFTDQQIIAKFKRRHLVDQAGILAVFLSSLEGQDDELQGTYHMLRDIRIANDEYNSANP